MKLVKLLFLFTTVILFSQNVYEITPDVQSCRAGKLTQEEKQKVLDKVNYIRSLHDLSPVEYESSGDEMSMEGCLNIVASGEGGHVDNPNSECYTSRGGEARMKSNLMQGWSSQPVNYTSVSAIIGWMIDENSGNPTKVGHRRAIINPFLKKIAFGRAEGQTKAGDTYMSAMNLLYQDYVTGSIDNSINFVAYPYKDYPKNLVNKDFYLSFNVIYNKSDSYANTDVDYSNVQITVTDENNSSLTVTDIQHDNEGWGSIPNNVSFKVAGLQDDIKYDVDIQNVIVKGNSEDYSYWFKLVDESSVNKPGNPVLAFPQNNSENVDIATSLSWNKTEFAQRYHLMLSKDSDFNELVVDKSDITSNSYLLAEDLEYTTEYFWKIKAINQAGESDWSEVWSFTTSAPKPDEVIAHYPKDGETEVSVTPLLKWSSVENALSYTIQVWDNKDMMGWEEFYEEGIADTTYQVDGSYELDYEKEYFWRIKARNQSGESNWTDLYGFTTKSPSTVIGNNDEIDLTVSPNPIDNNTYISFKMNQPDEMFFEVFDLSGRLIHKRNIGYLPKGKHIFNYEPTLKHNALFLRISIGNKIYYKKLFVK